MPSPQTTSWDRSHIAKLREQYYAASQKAFVPFREPMVFKRGQGQYLWDEQGRRYTDLLAMNVCVSAGHTHPGVTEAVQYQATQLQHCTTMFYHPVPAQYAQELAATLPASEDWTFHFCNSGAEAVDLALLLARSYTGNTDFVSLQTAYHGATFGAQALTGIANFRHPVVQLPGISFTPEPNTYRGLFGDDTQAYIEALERIINLSTCGKLAGMIIEPVQGYGGIVEMPDGYIKQAFAMVRAHGGLAIIDEVQSGVGRTGESMWAFSQHDVVPDIVVMAKGIGNGYPLGAIAVKKSIAECMSDKFLFHTYGANPVACAAGRAVLAAIQDEQLIANAKQVGAALLAELHKLADKFEVIGQVRGKGLMLAIELVKDRVSKEPDADATAKVFEAAREQGLILSKSGPHRSVLRFVPPLCLSMDDVEVIAHGLECAFKQLQN